MEWYRTLNVNQRINLKELFISICGVDFQKVGKLLSFKQRIDTAYNKLKLEGFDI